MSEQTNQKTKILLSFVGNNDCYLPEKPGAIISILNQCSFDKLYLLYNDESYLKPASAILEYCRRHFPTTQVFYQPAISADPTNYNTVYPAMYQAVREIVKENPDSDCTVSVTSGTPTMHACWIFLRQGGVINARLIQIQRETGISEIDFNLDDFPKIQNVSVVKAELTKLSRENKNLKERLSLKYDEIVGESPPILKVKEQIKIYATTAIPIFINGESGTGKELVASAIHFNSPRRDKPFVKVNCGAVSPQLFESEFFGHKKGSFTGALTDKEGKFKQADRGTIFLDEVGDLPLEMQVKLLRFLDNGTIQIVGGKEERVDVRVISATNKDIRTLVKNGEFREDLFYRLVQAEITLPPLRERGNDKILIANFILNELNRKYDQNKTLHSSAMALIQQHNWPGNIRQLRSALEVAFVYPGNQITAEAINIINLDEISGDVIIPSAGVDLENEVIPRYYQKALDLTNGNATAAAKLLRIEPATFRARLRKLGIKST